MALRCAVKLLVICLLFCLKCFTHVHCENTNAQELDENYFPTELQLISTKDQTIRVGEHLVLNCSLLVGAKNVSTVYKYQLSWFHGAQELTNATKKLSNRTIQLVIDHVSWSNNGTYVCRDTIKEINVEPVKVLVKVGDIPSAPRDVWVNNVEFQTKIHWTTPKHSGHLPLSYVVKAQCKNVTYPNVPFCNNDSFIVCDNSHNHPVTRSNPLKWSCEAKGGRLFSFSVVYKMFVEVSNYLGSTQSKAVYVKANRMDPLLTTPLPAKSFYAKEVSPAGRVRLSWEIMHPEDPRAYSIQYTILYHREEDIFSHNQTLIALFPQTSYSISGLAGFSIYHFFLRIRYGKRSINKYGSFSQAFACSLRTRISAPSEAPNITNCSKWSNHSTLLGLTVTWKNPSPETLNGPVNSMVFSFFCRSHGNAASAPHHVALNFTTSVTELTSHNVTIPAHQLANRCDVWMSICNGPGLCSAGSNICVVKNIKDVHPLTPISSTSNLTTLIAIVFGALSGLVLFGVIFWCLRRSSIEGPSLFSYTQPYHPGSVVAMGSSVGLVRPHHHGMADSAKKTKCQRGATGALARSYQFDDLPDLTAPQAKPVLTRVQDVKTKEDDYIEDLHLYDEPDQQPCNNNYYDVVGA